MLYIKTIIITSLLLITNTVLAKEQTYIRDYTYQASDTDSKVSARNASLLFLKQNLLSEIGTYVGSNINIVSVASGSEGVTVSAQQVKSLTEGFIKTEILEQKWNGVTFYVKAKMMADPDEIAEKLKAIAKASNSNKTKSSEEFDYWKSVVQIDAKAGYVSYIKKYPTGQYGELAQIALTRLSKAVQQNNSNWLVKRNATVLVIARHDTGTHSDLDGDVITAQMANTIKKMLSRYLPPDAKFKNLVDFYLTEKYLSEHERDTSSICNKGAADIIVGAMLADHEGTDGMSRPIRLFIRHCSKGIYKATRFVPTGSSSKDFWRKNDLQKNLRLFIQDYLDTV